MSSKEVSMASGQVALTLVRNSANEMGGLRRYGVSLSSMVKITEEFGLSQDEIAAVLVIKREFGASISKVSSLLRSDLDLEEIAVLYEARKMIIGSFDSDHGSRFKGVSLDKLLEFCRTFQISFEEESAQSIFEVLYGLHVEIKDIPAYGWIRTVDGTMSILIAIAKDHSVADPRAIVDFLSREEHWDSEYLDDFSDEDIEEF